MIQWLKKHWEVLSYLIFGVLTTLLNILLYALFNRLFGYTAANSWGNVLDNILCILFAYATNRAFVFRSKTQGREQAKEFGSLCHLPSGHAAAGRRHHAGFGQPAGGPGRGADGQPHERPAEPMRAHWFGPDTTVQMATSYAGHASGSLGWLRRHCRHRRGRWAHGHLCHQPHTMRRRCGGCASRSFPMSLWSMLNYVFSKRIVFKKK